MTAIILQARIDSSRLPGKALLPLDGKPVIFRVMEALNQITKNKEQKTESDFLKILACSEDSLSAFTPIAKDADFEIFAGPKEDVLERYCQVIRKYSVKRVIRATGDNPFVFADAAASINEEAVSLNADYGGYIDLPYGAGVETVSADALLRACKETSLPFNREHVCPYLYNNPDKFNIHRPLAPSIWRNPNIRLTIDTQEDYDNAIKLYNILKNDSQRNMGTTIINAYKDINQKEPHTEAHRTCDSRHGGIE